MTGPHKLAGKEEPSVALLAAPSPQGEKSCSSSVVFYLLDV